MKVNLFDNITITGEPEEIYIIMKLYCKDMHTAEPVAPAAVIIDAENGVRFVGADATVQEPDPLAPEPAPEAPKPKKAPAKRQAVDWPKARALRNAGWSLAKIADELGVSVPTVTSHLKEVKA